jgi:creatinine amidohydrolase
MTAPEIRARAGQDPVVILPLAAIEQHGPHLPLSTDLDIGLGLLDAAAARLGDATPCWCCPRWQSRRAWSTSRFPAH